MDEQERCSLAHLDVVRPRPDHVDLPPDHLYGPDVWAEDLPAACARYDRLLADLGGVDLQLLGIG